MRIPNPAIAIAVTLALALPAAAPVRAADSKETPVSATSMTTMPAVGQAAPDFTLPSTTGKDVTLSQFKGKTIVLYFYPKDETPGCTKEACDFRDRTVELEQAGVVVLGVSNDDLESHLHFKEKRKLPFPLLADVDAKVSKLYGVYGKQSVYGIPYTGIQRTTLVIGSDGRIARVWPKVSVNGHVEEVLKFVGTGEPSHDDPAKIVKSDAEWRSILSPEQYRVLRGADTELACSGKYWNEHRHGIYRCAACGYDLFDSKAKFDSGTGWPSFWSPVADSRLQVVKDATLGMEREEVRCARCDSHLGHVFDDGPKPTGQRYCMNSLALSFVEAKK